MRKKNLWGDSRRKQSVRPPATRQELPLQRLNYFAGQLLGADDLRAEQEYFLARARRHYRFLHGFGVVHGLTVVVSSSTELIVAPGVAIDCAGNEIHVLSPVTLIVKPSATAQFIVLRYTESLCKPVASLDADAPATFGRVCEGFRLSVSASDPCRDRHVKVGAPGCGRAHAIAVARVQTMRGRHLVQLLGRRSGRNAR